MCRNLTPEHLEAEPLLLGSVEAEAPSTEITMTGGEISSLFGSSSMWRDVTQVVTSSTGSTTGDTLMGLTEITTLDEE